MQRVQCLPALPPKIMLWRFGLHDLEQGKEGGKKKNRGCNDGYLEKGLNFTYSPWEGDMRNTSTHFLTPCHDHLSAALLPDTAKVLYSEGGTRALIFPCQRLNNQEPPVPREDHFAICYMLLLIDHWSPGFGWPRLKGWARRSWNSFPTWMIDSTILWLLLGLQHPAAFLHSTHSCMPLFTQDCLHLRWGNSCTTN